MIENIPSKFGTFAKDPLWQQIAGRLLSLLQEKQLQPGDKLPPERELAAMMQVSRASLREGLRALSMMNVIEVRQGLGTFITSLEPELLVEQLSLVLALDTSTITHLFQTRKIIEVGAIALAAEQITAEDIVAMKALLHKAENAVDDPALFLQTDVELHKKIIDIANNPILSRILESVSQLSFASRSRTNDLPGLRQQTVGDHQAIVAALEKRDPKAAQAAMLRHLNNIERKLNSALNATDNHQPSQEVPSSNS